jgi:hypothetical protein
MGIYNNIHDFDDDHYFYCARLDCACHGPGWYDASTNYDFFRTDHNIVASRADHARTVNNDNIYDLQFDYNFNDSSTYKYYLNYDHLDGA